MRKVALAVLVMICAYACADGGETNNANNANNLNNVNNVNNANNDNNTNNANNANNSNNSNNANNVNNINNVGDMGGDGGVDMSGPTTVPMFVAQGHMGRFTVSCDDGDSWIAEQSDDDAARCFTDGLDCDHGPGAGRGVTWGNGFFMATFGWGMPGGIQRSSNGIEWEEVLAETTFGGMNYGNGTFLAAARNARVSTDDGTTWTDPADTSLTVYNVRRSAFVPAMGGRFIQVGSDGDTVDIVTSTDGLTWAHPTTAPGTCGANIQTRGGIAYGNGVTVIAGGDGNVCYSTDGGDNWTAVDVGATIGSHLLFNGSAFVMWARGMLHQSTNGATWTSTATVPANLDLGPVAVNPDTGTIVGVRGSWQTWYEDQEFYRSSDGITWEVLPANRFTGSHPIRSMTFGQAEPSASCPL